MLHCYIIWSQLRSVFNFCDISLPPVIQQNKFLFIYSGDQMRVPKECAHA